MNHCKYHPIVEAEYYCEYCDVQTCSACSVEPSEFRQNSEFRCFVCNSRLDKLNLEDSIQPFWRRVPEIHQYPLSASGLAAIVVSSIVLLLSSILGSITVLLSSLIMLMYCFACLNESTTGSVDPPNFLNVLSGKANNILALLGIYIVAGVVIAFTFGLLGQGMGILVSLLFIIAIPAVLMVLAVEQSMFGAMNVGKIFQIIKACGYSYLLMLLFIIILSSSMGIAASLIETDNGMVFLFLSNLISSYYLIIIFHVMGYLVYQNNHSLDFYVMDQNHEEVKARPEHKLAEMEVEVLLKNGQFKQATEKCYHRLKQDKSNTLLWRKYFTLITETRNQEAVLKFADHYFEKLVALEDGLSLAQAYNTLKLVAPDLQPQSLEMKFHIAEASLNSRHFSAVPILLQNISKETQDKVLVKKALEMIAKAFSAIPEQKHKAKRFADMASMIDSPSLP